MLVQSTERTFKPINMAVMTISDTRTESTDSAGKLLVERLHKAGHTLAEKAIVTDSLYQIRAMASKWIAGFRYSSDCDHRRYGHDGTR